MEILNYKTETLVEVAYRAIKKDITERILVPGQKIVVRELHERYGISETPIKQALNRLVTEGLVESFPRRGMCVRKVKWQEIEELMDIRCMFETYYIDRVMETFKNNAEIREKFLENLTEHKRIIENIRDLNDYFQNYYLDQEFHQLFVKCSGNHRMLQIYNNLGTHVYAHYVYGRQPREGMIQGVKEHEAIYHALTAQDEAELRRCIEVHIANAKKNVYEMLQHDQDR
ncbi:GntR family transcriptional regulator [Paenibacillus thermoaerophilus]|uniref:GntR family transcriptional regulator n=1 Tax=Paenibacillus thermoaerophilus TaxID=1215385 RepID=A0ABW2V657_9BACL|nr:GntR family transcriptional regulator [Paenibacillus thermoaerophilus]TMV17186.1 GntR family transcriptional regulator [Paenibacillus thermoaerophilus]